MALVYVCTCSAVGSLGRSRLRHGAKLGSRTTAAPRSSCTPRYDVATAGSTLLGLGFGFGFGFGLGLGLGLGLRLVHLEGEVE